MAFADRIARPFSGLFGALGRAPARRAAPAAPAFEMLGLADIDATAEFRRDPAAALMTLLFAALALFLALGLWFGTFAKQETMRGTVAAASGAVRVAAPLAGTVERLWVRQGDLVKAGQRLATVAPQQSAAGGGSLAAADVAALDAERLNLSAEIARLSALLDRDAGDRLRFEADEASLEATLRAQETRLSAAIGEQERDVARMRRSLAAGYATRDQLAGYEARLLESGRQLAETQGRIAELSSTVTQRRRDLDRARAQTENDRSAMASRLDDIDARLKRSKSAVASDVLASADGAVAAVNVREGASVAAGDVLVALADPAAPIRIALEAPSGAIGLIEPGQRVVLKYDAFPFKTFGIQYGRVASVGEAPLAVPKSLDPGAGPAGSAPRPVQSTFLVEVEPERRTVSAYGEERPILIGSTLSADVVVERRRLIDWVLDPILAMRGRL